MSSHSPLRRTSVRSGSSTVNACCWKVSALRVDLLAGELRPRRRAPARVAHARGVVADDQHDGVAAVLELAQLAQDHGVAEVDVGRGRVDPELHPQRPALAQLALERALGQGVDGVAGEETGRLARGLPSWGQC